MPTTPSSREIKACLAERYRRPIGVVLDKSATGRSVRWHDVDDDVADLPPGLDVPVGLDDLVQRVPPVDEWPELSGLDQLPEVPHHLLTLTLTLTRGREPHLLAAGQWRDERQDEVL